MTICLCWNCAIVPPYQSQILKLPPLNKSSTSTLPTRRISTSLAFLIQVRRLNLLTSCDTPAETEAFVKSLPISVEKPWIMQEFISGKEYCTHSTKKRWRVKNVLLLWVIRLSSQCENVDLPAIMDESFAKLGHYQAVVLWLHSSLLTELFTRSSATPRTHHAITMFYNHPGVADAYPAKSL